MRTDSWAERIPPLPDRLLIGFSGGADSTALLLMMKEARENGRIRELTAVHVNHGLRGAESDRDENFARTLCGKLDIALICCRLDLPPDASEDTARKARYACFREAMQKSGADALALAHHRDDQAETVLLHLLRGSGLDGLGGMSSDTVVNGLRIVRPLLSFGREELRDYLREAGQDWCEDSTNAQTAALRNRVRHELIPMLNDMIPGVDRRLAAVSEQFREDALCLRRQAGALLEGCAGERWLRAKPLADAEPSIQKRALRLWWARACASGRDERALSFEQTADMAAVLNGKAGDRCSLPGGWTVWRGWHCLHLVAPGGAAPHANVILKEELPQGNPGDGAFSQEVPRVWLEDCTVRTWQEGDWIRPFGMKGRKKLQDYLTDRRIDAPFRRMIPLLCRGSEVLLVAGVGAGSVPQWQNSPEMTRLTWAGEMPWTYTD